MAAKESPTIKYEDVKKRVDKWQTLKHYFGYDDFRPSQEKVIDSILNGRDVLAVMPTGAGKSICYQIPGLMLPGITLVISPLISLMKDQVRALNEAGVHAAYINSSLTERQIAKALENARGGQYKIIYVAPERLESSGFIRFAESVEISLVTVDEAHCISQWGQDFRPSYLNIINLVERLVKRPIVAAFTATATEAVKEDILCVLKLENPYVAVTGFDRKNLYFEVRTPRDKLQETLSLVREHGAESGIIYCATRKNVEQVHEYLNRQGIPAGKYHAGMSMEERKQNQNDFIYDERPLIVATNAFGMGIDKSNVRYVLHYNMPQSIENYYQEAGRAGRDGERAECILLYSAQDVMINTFLIENKASPEDKTQEEIRELQERDMKRLRSMSGYCSTKDCLRAYLLGYFGEKTADCGNCSNCLAEHETVDVTECSRNILQCIEEVRGRFGINVIVGILRGERTDKLLSYGFDSLPSYGTQKDKSEKYLKQVIAELSVREMFHITEDKYGLVKKGPNASQIMEGSVFIKMSREQERKKVKRKAQRTADVLTSRGFELFEKLREERLRLAREEGLPPYLVASDKTLVDMCRKAPGSKTEMLMVYGMGEHKFAKYGQEFLNVIGGFTHGIKENLTYGG